MISQSFIFNTTYYNPINLHCTILLTLRIMIGRANIFT